MKKISISKGLKAIAIAIFLILYFYYAASLVAMPLKARPMAGLAMNQLTIQQLITGRVTYGGMPVAGVTVEKQEERSKRQEAGEEKQEERSKRQEAVVLTDVEGRFGIAASVGDVLVFSYSGFKTRAVTVTSMSPLTIELEEDVQALKEVTVNAGYYSVKESERTGSIAKISAKDIEKQPVTNVLAAMQGRMAGVNITQQSGVAGGGFDIQIRGINSLRGEGNSQLYVIDGVPYASEAIGSFYTSSTTTRPTSPLNSINPSDIESVELLKDADATAIYGSRGANGVVLLTTKKGKEGKTRFSTTLSSGFGHVTRFMDVLQTPAYLQMRREAYANDGIADYPADAYDINGTWDVHRNTDWQKELLGRTSSYTTVQSSLSGGSAQTQFLLNGAYSKETTVFPGDFRYLKGNVHLNLQHASLDKKFHLQFTSGYTAQNNTLPSTDLTREAQTLAPNAPALYDASGQLNWENGTFQNPLRLLNGTFGSKTNDLLANSLLSYELLEGLTLKSSFGFSALQHDEINAIPSTVYNPAYGLGSESSVVFETVAHRKSWIVEPQLDWQRKWGAGKISFLVGSTFQQQKDDRVVHLGYGFASNSLLLNPGSASYFSILESSTTDYKYQAFFGRLNYNWKEKYLFNITGRRDGSSRFGTDNRFAFFGAVGAAWLFSKEALVRDRMSFWSFGKLRASYGTTGSDQIGDYQYLDTYSNSGTQYQGISGLQPSRLFNAAFGWETNKKLEVALETGFLQDRIFTTVAWYRNRSSNQLVGVPLAGTTGFSSLQANLDATVQNAGVELSLRTVNVQRGDFSWITSLNFTKAKNELVSFPNLESSPYKSQYVLGQPLSVTKVFHFLGVDPQTGVYQFADVNGDGVISAVDDREFTKDLSPRYYGGFQNQFRYAGAQLDFLFQFVKQENFTPLAGSALPGTLANQPAGVANHWQNPGDNAPYQQYSSGTNAVVQQAQVLYGQSDAAVADASYVRLKNVSLTYDLPKQWTKSFGCKIGLAAQNLLTFTKYTGADPEFRTGGYLPPLRIITTSIQLTF